jgi:hypothetical protein
LKKKVYTIGDWCLTGLLVSWETRLRSMDQQLAVAQTLSMAIMVKIKN